MKNIQLTTFEVISTLAIVGLVPIVLSYPQNIAKTFESASVLNYVYTIFIVLLFYIIFYKLYKPFSGKNILGISNFLGGKTLENIFGFSVATYLLILSIPTLHEFGQDLKNMMFTNSLVSEINLFLILGVLLGLFTGMRGLFRISGLVFSFVLIGLFLMFIALYGKIDLTNLTPIFGTGYNEVFVNGFFRIGIFNSLFILLFVAPSVKNIKKAGFY